MARISRDYDLENVYVNNRKSVKKCWYYGPLGAQKANLKLLSGEGKKTRILGGRYQEAFKQIGRGIQSGKNTF